MPADSCILLYSHRRDLVFHWNWLLETAGTLYQGRQQDKETSVTLARQDWKKRPPDPPEMGHGGRLP